MARIVRPCITRRCFLKSVAAGVALSSGGIAEILAQGTAPAAITRDSARPQIPLGVMSGDVTGERVVIWSKCDRPGRIFVEYSTSEQFRDAKRIAGPAAIEDSDFTARVDLSGLVAGQDLFYRVTFQDLENPKIFSAPTPGRLRVVPASTR